jgi:phospholipase/carboxylesterase
MVKLPGLLGFHPGRIVLGGFSQGGTTGMAYAYTRPGTVTAALNFSGFLADSPTLPTAALGPDATPVFWGHGTRDPNIPHGLAEKGREILDRNGAPLTIGDYDIGHWIDPAEVADAVRFVEELER